MLFRCLVDKKSGLYVSVFRLLFIVKMASKKQRLPNLKICVDNTESTDDSDSEVRKLVSASEALVRTQTKKRYFKREDNELLEDDQDVVLSISEEPTERRFLSRKELSGAKSNAQQYGVNKLLIRLNIELVCWPY